MQLIVLGMHRSGTSAVARLLNMMGAYYAPANLAMPASHANPTGHWERTDVVALNDKILDQLGFSWHKLSGFHADLLDDKLYQRFAPDMRSIMQDLETHRPWMTKDPRMCLLLPLWQRVFEVPVYVYVHRDPLEIAYSLKRREENVAALDGAPLYPLHAAGLPPESVDFPLPLGLALWELYSLQALRAMNQAPCVFVSYQQLLNDPVATVKTLHSQLEAQDVTGLRLPAKREIQAYLDVKLHRQKGDDNTRRQFITVQQQAVLAQIETGELFANAEIPKLSGAAADSLRVHQDRLELAQRMLRQQDENKTQVTQQQQAQDDMRAELQQTQIALTDTQAALSEVQTQFAAATSEQNAQLSQQQQALDAAEQRATRLRQHFNSALENLSERDGELASQRAASQALRTELSALQAQEGEQAANVRHEYAQVVAQRDAEIGELSEDLGFCQGRFQQLVYWVNGLEADVDAVFKSLTWRIGSAVTNAILTLTLRRGTPTAQDHIRDIRQQLAELKNLHNPTRSEAGATAGSDRSASSAPGGAAALGHSPYDYALWVKKYDSFDANQRRAMQAELKKISTKPLISILMPVYNAPEKLLRAAIESVQTQIYSNWELCIADDASSKPHVKNVLKQLAAKDPRIKVCYREQNGHISAASNSALALAEGEFITFLDHDDVLPEYALYWVFKAIQAYPDAQCLYSDEDKIDANGVRQAPHFKPAWNPDLLRSYNYLNHLTIYRAELVKAANGFRESFHGAQDYDLALRITETLDPQTIIHIPHVLYHWRITADSTAASETQKPYALQAAQRAIAEHLQRCGIVGATVSGAPELPGANRVTYAIPQPAPLVSIIIPTRNGLDILKVCIDSIQRKTSYPNYEIIIVDNDSDDPATLIYMDDLADAGVARILRYPHPFNYAAINNFAAEHANGSVLCLLNNDIEIITRNWLEELVGHALRPSVGAVGARLWYPDDTLQHGGVIVGLGGVAGHSHKYFPRHDPGYMGRLRVTQNLSAVTAACLVLRKEVYASVEGLDAENLSVAFNDVDFCLRINEAGWRVVWTPYVDMYHHESISRGQEDSPEKIRRFQRECAYMQTRWKGILLHDPAYNPNLTLDMENFAYAWPPHVGDMQKPLIRQYPYALRQNSPSLPVAADSAPVPHDDSPRHAGKSPEAEQTPTSRPAAEAASTPSAVALSPLQQALSLLHGKGLHIRPFTQRLPLADDCQLACCDAVTLEVLQAAYAEVPQDAFVPFQHICNLDTDALPYADDSLDFVICLDELTRLANPIRAVAEIFRVLKPTGQVVLAVPDKRFNFNQYRALTEFASLKTNYDKQVREVSDDTYQDFLRVTHPGVFLLAPEALQSILNHTRQRREHAQVWDSASFAAFLERSLQLLNIQAKPVFVSTGDDNKEQYMSVWQKLGALLRRDEVNLAAIPAHLRHRQAGYQLLSGKGIEIGALHQPAILPKKCQVEYCDVASEQETGAIFSELGDEHKLTQVTHVFNVDTDPLPFKADSLDFIVFNHVLEHVANPIQAVEKLFTVLKPGGHIVLSIPDKRFCFDSPRALTSFEHLWEEYEQGVTDVTDEHYLDFLRAVHPEQTHNPDNLTHALEHVRNRREHAHVWDSDSFAAFLDTALDKLGISAEAVHVSHGDANQNEYFSVWKKH